MGDAKAKLEVLKVLQYENSGRLLAGPTKDGLFFPLNSDLSFSGKDSHRVKRGTQLKETSYRIEFEVTRDGNAHKYRRIRYWDVRHLPEKVSNPSAPLEQRIDISPSQAYTDGENRYSGRYAGNPAGYILICAAIFSLWMVGVWGWEVPALLLCLGGVIIALTKRPADPARVKEIEAAKKRVRDIAADEFEEAINTSEVWKALDGIGFENAVSHIFSRTGYEVQHTPRSHDKGVDLILKKDGRTILVQCKAYKGNVGVKDVRELLGARSQWPESNELWVVALNGFSKSARDFADENSIKLVSVMRDHLQFDLKFENG